MSIHGTIAVTLALFTVPLIPYSVARTIHGHENWVFIMGASLILLEVAFILGLSK
jgi:hypothetical protein